MTHPAFGADGALLVDKHEGTSSFGIIEELQRLILESGGLKRRDLPKIGHGGTLDPFATGLLAVCVGHGVKLARYFLGSTKTYEGVIRFGETTVPGDPTSPVTETTDQVPESLERIREMAHKMTLQPYLQTPPMHSAKKKDGKPLYELARQGIEVEREAKLCRLYSFEILDYADRRARFRVVCSSGTYVRTLAQDLARLLGSLALLETLRRTASGALTTESAWTTARIAEATRAGSRWDTLPCWVPFDRLLDGYDRAEATSDEATALMQGKQNVLFSILKRAETSPVRQALGHPDQEESRDHVAIYCSRSLIAVARRDQGVWGLERVFSRQDSLT